MEHIQLIYIQLLLYSLLFLGSYFSCVQLNEIWNRMMIQGGLILNMNRPAITDVSKEGGTIRLQPHPDLKVLRIGVKPTTFRKKLLQASRLCIYIL